MTIVVNGLPTASIVLRPKPSDRERHAAAEIQSHRTSSRAGGLNCEPLKAVCVEQIMRPLKGDDYSPSCS